MSFDPKQILFEDIVLIDADPGTRRLLLLHRTWHLFLVDWFTGDQVALPRFEVPSHHHHATQGWKAYTLGPSILDLRLGEHHACILTTEGLWTCELRENATWVRVAGHPTDPPKGMTLSNRSSFDFRGPIALARDRTGLRCGSRPVVLSADGSTVVGAPNMHDVLGCAVDYTLELKMLTVSEPEPLTLPPKLRSEVRALAVSADGAVVAFSEGRDFRVIHRGQKRASHLMHNKMYVYALALSPDGRFAAASGLYPDDLRTSPRRTVLWEVASREVVDIVPASTLVGFVGYGEGTRLVLTLRNHGRAFQQQSQLFVPGTREAVAAIPGLAVESARGDTRFLVVRRGEYEAQVIPEIEKADDSPGPNAADIVASSQVTSLASRIDEAPGATANIFLYHLGSLQKNDLAGFMAGGHLWEAADCLIRYAILGDVKAASTLFQALLPTVTKENAAYSAKDEPDWRRILACLSLQGLAESGVATSYEIGTREMREGLLRLKPSTNRDALRLAWAGLAMGEYEWSATVLPFNPATEHRSRAFGINTERIFSHLFRAATGSGEADATGAWRAWLRAFPTIVVQESSSWPELLWAAHVTHCQIGGAPADTLVEWLRKETRATLDG